MTDPSPLQKYLQYHALVYHSHTNIPNRDNQLACLEASVAHIINNPLAIKPYSWALSTLLHSLSVEDALSILQKLIKKNPGSKGLIKLSKLYDLIRMLDLKVLHSNTWKFPLANQFTAWRMIFSTRGVPFKCLTDVITSQSLFS